MTAAVDLALLQSLGGVSRTNVNGRDTRKSRPVIVSVNEHEREMPGSTRPKLAASRDGKSLTMARAVRGRIATDGGRGVYMVVERTL
jgi:hypothetical protein